MTKKVYIGIDPSLSSTACCIRIDDRDMFANFTTNKITGKWYKMLESVNFHELSLDTKGYAYSESEIIKALQYADAAKYVWNNIFKMIPRDASYVGIAIESYSQSSMAGPLIDLVTFSTLLRREMLIGMDGAYKHHISVVAPMSLKVFACETAYGDRFINPKSKKVLRSDEGIAGGSFKKREMLKAAADTHNSCPLLVHIDDVQSVLMMSGIPKPIDDLIDAWWLTNYANSVVERTAVS